MNTPLSNDCPFCFLINKTLPDIPISLQVDGYEQLKQELIYKGNFVNVKPDVSPITKNHFLIIPINHYFSSLTIPPEEIEELNQVKKRIENFYFNEMDKICIYFEHGSCNDSKGSACIHHAHIHSIPVDEVEGINLINYAIRILGTPVSRDNIDINKYLYLESENSKPLYWSDSGNESQFFRRIIAEVLGFHNRTTWQGCILYPDQRELSYKWLMESSLVNI